MKIKSYLERYKHFVSSPKTYTVEFFKEYEGKGGYWDYRDMWIDGPTIHETCYIKTFDTIEDALAYADLKQKEILELEKEREKKNSLSYKGIDNIHWISEPKFSFDESHTDLIYAHINWGGSSYYMKLSYSTKI